MNVLRGKVVLKETSAGIPDLIVVVEDVHAVRWAEANGADLARLRVRRPSPEDIYLSLTQTRKEAAGDCARCLRPRSASASGRLDGPLAWHQFHYDLRAFFRNRQARFFTLGPAGAVPGHLRLGVHRHHQGRGRVDRHLGLLRPRHHHAGDHQRRIRQSRSASWTPTSTHLR